MRRTIIHDLSEKDMQAVANEYTLSQFYFPTLFPFKYTPTLKWEQLEGEFGAPVAGDMISFDSRAPRKRREVVSKLSGNIGKIGVAREKTESEMNEYNLLRRLADDEAKKRLVEWIWEDQEFVFTGVNARLEWLALRAASTGKVKLTTLNNEGVVTEADVDFLVPNANKSGVDVPITGANSATSKPISLIKTKVKEAKQKGKKLNYILTDQDMIDSILASAETLKTVAPWVAQATNLTQTPTLAALNTALSGLNLPKIVLVESFINLEIKGERTLVNPWEPGVLLFSEAPTLGNTYHASLADEFVESTNALKIKRNHVLIKRFANEEPLVETCLAISNSFPVLANANSKWLVDGLNTSWSK